MPHAPVSFLENPVSNGPNGEKLFTWPPQTSRSSWPSSTMEARKVGREDGQSDKFPTRWSCKNHAIPCSSRVDVYYLRCVPQPKN